MNGKRTPFGFTLLEVLVVVLIVGILAAVGIYGLNISRSMNRDAKRLSDVSVIRAALTQYWLQAASYPAHDGLDLGRPGANADRLGASGFVAGGQQAPSIFLDRIPVGPKVNEWYQYRGSAQGYALRFVTERETVYGAPGVWFAHTNGVDTDANIK